MSLDFLAQNDYEYEYIAEDMLPEGDVYPSQQPYGYPTTTVGYGSPQMMAQQYGYNYPQQQNQNAALQQYNWYYYTYLPWLRQVQAQAQQQQPVSSSYNYYVQQCAAQGGVWDGSQCNASPTTLKQQCLANQGIWNALTNTCGTSIAQQCAAQGGTYIKARDGIALCTQVATQYAPISQNEYALHMYIAQALANNLIQQTVAYGNISAFDSSGNSSYRNQKFRVLKGKKYVTMNFTQTVQYLQKSGFSG
jgi:hypothetical protein